MNERGAFFTVKETAELFSVHPATVHRWIKQGRLEPRVQFLGGTYLRFIFPCSEVIKFLDNLPTLRTLNDPNILKLMELRRLYIKKAAAARMAKKSAKARGEGPHE